MEQRKEYFANYEARITNYEPQITKHELRIMTYDSGLGFRKMRKTSSFAEDRDLHSNYLEVVKTCPTWHHSRQVTVDLSNTENPSSRGHFGTLQGFQPQNYQHTTVAQGHPAGRNTQ